MLVTMLPANTGNHGLPVNLFDFGEAGLARAALVVMVNSLMHATLGVYIAARGRATSVRESLKRALSVSIIYAAAIGVIINVTGRLFGLM